MITEVSKIYSLYRITNLLNSKVYIGQATDVAKRWSDHKRSARLNKPTQIIHHALIKYGLDNFIFEVIACCKGQENANELETLLVEQYDSYVNNGKGYNATLGGMNAPKTDAWKQKMSAAMEEIWKTYSDDKKEKIFKAISEANIGRIQSKEEIEKRTISIIDFWENNPEQKEIHAKRAKQYMEDNPEHSLKFTRKDAIVSEETKQKMREADNAGFFVKNNLPWNKNTTGIMKANSGSFKPGQSISPETQFKKGRNLNAWNRKLTEEQEKEIVEKYTNGMSQRELAAQYSIDRTCIRRVLLQNSLLK